MGSSQICNSDTADRKAEVEQVAFQHVNSHLENMVFCSEADLAQAAKSYFYQSVRTSGAGHLFREAYVEAKAQRIAKWWNEKHTASRTPRPHTLYTPAQAARGRAVASMRKRNRNNWQALQVQLIRQGGGKVAEVAEQFGCTTRNIYKLSKRRFPKLVAVVLALALGVNVPKSSVGFLSQNQGMDQKETLRPFTFDEGTPAHPPPLGNSVDLDAIAAAIPDLIRSHWAAQGL